MINDDADAANHVQLLVASFLGQLQITGKKTLIGVTKS